MSIFPASTSSVIGVLMSGGLDSAILIGQLLAEGREVQSFYVRCGLAWESIERAASERFFARACRIEPRGLSHSITSLDGRLSVSAYAAASRWASFPGSNEREPGITRCSSAA